ncbi:DNA replication regulator SLD3-like protein [Stemphylium lycopersici]|uniref:DNA replication regulator SLD3-like protein n=1 Tax=Stemphylium lycopersici TaxID=183478 RepID=A0A364N2T7_STELY|nr:DNA replication regulator SLD3-like protein [Stemphylium lycopersici]
MTTYALQTKTMLQPVSDTPTQLLRLAAKHEEPKPQLPSKLKRDTLCGLGASNKPVTIRPHSESPYARPVTFRPVRVVGRSQLPLTFLDTSTDDDFASNSRFAARIDILEDDESNNGYHAAPRVLIAQLETKKSLCAIERVQPHVYSICRLAGWLKERDVADLWDPANLQRLSIRPKADMGTNTQGGWWQHAAIETQTVEPLAERARLSMLRPKLPQAPTTVESQLLETSTLQVIAGLDTVPIENPLEPLPAPLSPQEQLETLVHQYLDAVYMSKTSLAYLAKGPITRIRNAFTLADQGAPPTHDLVAFLRAMLLSPKASEKKYYDKLPALIKAMPPGSYSDDEPAAGAIKAKKSKKKVKLSRDGVYPQEESLVKKWWHSELPSGDTMATETIDQRIKRRIGDLRVRETLAQLILMLEIIALEANSTSKPPEKQPTGDESQNQGEQPAPKKRKKKLDDINVQLDLLLDKLCIWHATEEVGILDFDAKPSRQNENSDSVGRNGTNDRLHSFCVEVIIPFYINRLPEQALMVNKKLGGPAHSLPSKRKANRPPITSRKSKDSKEPEAKKSRRSLARVATDNTGRTIERTTPSLSRSATDSALIDGIKREGSEVPLSAIPFRRSPSKSARQSMSQIRHLQGRQIDLAQPSAAASAKIKQKQRVEEDLQEAISALKKPNRGLAAGGYIAEIEQRGLGLPSKSRKPAVTVRKSVKEVQVSATPRVGRRTKNMVEQTPRQPDYDPFVRPPGSGAPHSSGFCVPSSGVRPPPAMVPATGHRHATARDLAQSSIAETPSKAPPAKAFSSETVRRRIFATPLKAAAPCPHSRFDGLSHVFETPGKVIGNSPPNNTNFEPPAVVATPTKSFSMPASEAVPVPFSALGHEDDTEPSIYDALGWNDDDDAFA